MKIRIVESIDDYTDSISQDMIAENSEGKTMSFNVYPLCECPEDAIIGRDLISCTEIADAMKFAYEAGKAGEPFEIAIVGEEADE